MKRVVAFLVEITIFVFCAAANLSAEDLDYDGLLEKSFEGSSSLADLSEAEMKKDSSAAGKGAVAAEPMKKMDSEDEDTEDLGTPVVKGDEKKADAAKSVKKDGSIKAKVKGDWLIKLPEEFSQKQAMAIGTAGYTAMLCVLALEKNSIK